MSRADDAKRRRHGPEPLPVEARRGHCVSVRLNSGELAALDQQRVGCRMQRGEYLRAAALHQLPPVIPPINQEAWAVLARAIGNLNQYQTAINQGRAPGDPIEVATLRDLVQSLRLELIGAGKK